MFRAVADTHTVIWYLFADERLSAAARATMEEAASSGDQIAFSSITLAEIVYLTEKGRIAPATLDRLLTAMERERTLCWSKSPLIGTWLWPYARWSGVKFPTCLTASLLLPLSTWACR